MSTSNLDSADLKGALGGSLIREDVMDKIFNISPTDLPFTNLIGSTSVDQEYTEWTNDSLSTPDTTNAKIDGQDLTGNDAKVGTRSGNHCQISTKVVRVSFRADESNKIGRAKELAYQISMRQKELRRDVEAIVLTNQASVADDGATTAGKVGGLPSWIKTNFIDGGTGATAGGFNTTTKLTAAFTSGAAEALTEANLRTAIEQVYTEGGDASVMMSVPGVISQFSKFMLSTGGHVAQIHSEVDGRSREAVTALGAVNVFVTDFGTIRAVPNRIQPTFKIGGTGNSLANVFVLDPQYIELGILRGYRTEELARTGLAENRMITVDYTLKVTAENAQAMIANIDPSLAMTA